MTHVLHNVMLIQSRPIQDVFLCSFSIFSSSIMVCILGFSVGKIIFLMPYPIPARQYSRCLLCEDTGDYSLPATATLIGQWYCLKIQKKLIFYMFLSLHTSTFWLKKHFFCNITISFPFTQCSDRAVGVISRIRLQSGNSQKSDSTVSDLLTLFLN